MRAGRTKITWPTPSTPFPWLARSVLVSTLCRRTLLKSSKKWSWRSSRLWWPEITFRTWTAKTIEETLSLHWCAYTQKRGFVTVYYAVFFLHKRIFFFVFSILFQREREPESRISRRHHSWYNALTRSLNFKWLVSILLLVYPLYRLLFLPTAYCACVCVFVCQNYCGKFKCENILLPRGARAP